MARKQFEIYSLSFLDCICCGFGAVILLFVIVNAKAAVMRNEKVKDLRGEVTKWELLVQEGKKDLVVARNTVEETTDEIVKTEGLSSEIIRLIEESKEELATSSGDTVSVKEHVNQLKSDIQALEAGVKRLAGGSDALEEGGDKVKAFQGDGDRQYLTGFKVGGRRILVLVDGSASMLGKSIVDIVRRRAQEDEQKRKSPKWQQAVRTVDWVTTQMPPTSQFQIYTFNETATPLVEGTGGTWMSASDPDALNKAVASMKEVVPDKGTNLYNAFAVIKEMESPPDNIILLIDSLPSMGARKGFRKKVSANKRLALYKAAIKTLPPRVPVNVILFPMEGDPLAASSYWGLAVKTRGSFLCPSKDWP